MSDADVGRIDMPVHIEIANPAVSLFTDMVREPAEGEQIVGLKEREAVLSVQAFARENLLSDRFETRVGDLESGQHIQYGASGTHDEDSRAPEQQEQ